MRTLQTLQAFDRNTHTIIDAEPCQIRVNVRPETVADPTFAATRPIGA